MNLSEFITERRERARRTIFAVAGEYALELLNELELLSEEWDASEAKAEDAPPYDSNNPRQFIIPVTFREGCNNDYAIYVGDKGNTFKMQPNQGESLAFALRMNGEIPQDTAHLSYRH